MPSPHEPEHRPPDTTTADSAEPPHTSLEDLHAEAARLRQDVSAHLGHLGRNVAS